MNNWQTPLALGVVLATAVGMIFRWLRPKKNGCGGGCGCAGKDPRKS